jgi:hypothetical protein
MQTNLKFNSITFFNPVYERSGMPKNVIHVTISIAAAGKQNNNNYYFYVKNLLLLENLNWRYVKIGHENGNLYVTKGNEDNGYKISTQGTVNNKHLVATIFNMFNVATPNQITKRKKIIFTFQKIDNDMFILQKN